ncbi:MAG: hypothetical protein GY869_09025, partial [Planctomycetes bacterium]|nr:hypothetical protein [Planctomycetota bacterium]
ILEDGTTVTINNEREMRAVYEDCGDRPGDGGNREDCFEYVLPVTFIMPDGSAITVNTEEDWVTLRGWYADHPDVRERPAVQYPVDVTLVEDGTTVTVNNDEEMRAVYADCFDRPGGDDDGEYDCPELRANIGDDCRTEDGVVGVINDNCECE